MYVTGGVGSTSIGEAFTIDYDLPNETSYAETCASIAMAMFCGRMLESEIDSRYSDIIEREIYNGIISGISLDGTSFFYENALGADPAFHSVNTSTTGKKHLPILERVNVFYCSCCPPNLVRSFSSVAGYFYSYREKTLFVHQYGESTLNIIGTEITQRTDYPVNGRVEITVNGKEFDTVAVRIPGWCRNFTISEPYTIKKGYAYIKVSDGI